MRAKLTYAVRSVLDQRVGWWSNTNMTGWHSFKVLMLCTEGYEPDFQVFSMYNVLNLSPI